MWSLYYDYVFGTMLMLARWSNTISVLSHHVCMDRTPLGLDELIEHWTVLNDQRKLIAGKLGATRLGFTPL